MHALKYRNYSQIAGFEDFCKKAAFSLDIACDFSYNFGLN